MESICLAFHKYFSGKKYLKIKMEPNFLACFVDYTTLNNFFYDPDSIEEEDEFVSFTWVSNNSIYEITEYNVRDEARFGLIFSPAILDAFEFYYPQKLMLALRLQGKILSPDNILFTDDRLSYTLHLPFSDFIKIKPYLRYIIYYQLNSLSHELPFPFITDYKKDKTEKIVAELYPLLEIFLLNKNVNELVRFLDYLYPLRTKLQPFLSGKKEIMKKSLYSVFTPQELKDFLREYLHAYDKARKFITFSNDYKKNILDERSFYRERNELKYILREHPSLTLHTVQCFSFDDLLKLEKKMLKDILAQNDYTYLAEFFPEENFVFSFNQHLEIK